MRFFVFFSANVGIVTIVRINANRFSAKTLDKIKMNTIFLLANIFLN